MRDGALARAALHHSRRMLASRPASCAPWFRLRRMPGLPRCADTARWGSQMSHRPPSRILSTTSCPSGLRCAHRSRHPHPTLRLGAEPGEAVTVPSLCKSLIGFKQARLLTRPHPVEYQLPRCLQAPEDPRHRRTVQICAPNLQRSIRRCSRRCGAGRAWPDATISPLFKLAQEILVSDGASQLSTHRADRAGSIRTLRTLRDTSPVSKIDGLFFLSSHSGSTDPP